MIDLANRMHELKRFVVACAHQKTLERGSVICFRHPVQWALGNSKKNVLGSNSGVVNNIKLLNLEKLGTPSVLRFKTFKLCTIWLTISQIICMLGTQKLYQ